jgi:type IV pilus assembly protein PilA
MQDLLQRLRKLRSEKNEAGFTLIELLVVVVIIGILIAIAIPLYLNYENGAKNKSSASDLRGAIATIEQCYTDGNNVYPTSITGGGSGVAYTFLPLTGSGACTGKINTSSGSTIVYKQSADVSSYSLAAYQGATAPTATAGNWYCYSSVAGGSVKTENTGYTGAYMAVCP